MVQQCLTLFLMGEIILKKVATAFGRFVTGVRGAEMSRRRLPPVHELPRQVPKYLPNKEEPATTFGHGVSPGRLQTARAPTPQRRNPRLLHRQQHLAAGPLREFFPAAIRLACTCCHDCVKYYDKLFAPFQVVLKIRFRNFWQNQFR